MRLPRKPPLAPKHREERLKLLAAGLQNFAIALFLGVLVLPAFNATLATSWSVRVGAFLVCGVAEAAALVLLRYIPPPDAT